MTEDHCVYSEIGELNRRGSETPKPNPTTEHVVLQRSIELIMDLRDEVAKLRRTVAAQYGEMGEGITDDLLCRFRDMLERAYPRRGKDESVESWTYKLGPMWGRIREMQKLMKDMELRRADDMDKANAEFDRTIRQGGILRNEP